MTTVTPGSAELLACPCCGSASEPSTAFDGSVYEGHVVICTSGKCGCQSGVFPTPAMAKRAWNTRLAAKPAEEVDYSFDLRETLRAVLEFWGVDGAAKVTRHVMLARRSRDSNAEIDALEEIFGPPSTETPKP